MTISEKIAVAIQQFASAIGYRYGRYECPKCAAPLSGAGWRQPNRVIPNCAVCGTVTKFVEKPWEADLR
jgi:hypothetical protein